MLVYRAGRASVVHLDPECAAARGAALLAIEVTALKAARWCRTCTPEQLHQRPRTRLLRCAVCRQSRPLPCAHNGGIPVINVDTMSMNGTEVRRVNTRWRWPENVQGAVTRPCLAENGAGV